MDKIIFSFSGFSHLPSSSLWSYLHENTKERTRSLSIREIQVDSFEDCFGGQLELEEKHNRLRSTKQFSFLFPKTSYENAVDKFVDYTLEAFGKNIWHNLMESIIVRDPKTFYWVCEAATKKDFWFLDTMKKKHGFRVVKFLVLGREYMEINCPWAKYGLNPAYPEDAEIIVKDFGVPRANIEWCRMNPKFNAVIHDDDHESTNASLKRYIETFHGDILKTVKA